jgi:hypothetical protein
LRETIATMARDADDMRAKLEKALHKLKYVPSITSIHFCICASRVHIHINDDMNILFREYEAEKREMDRLHDKLVSLELSSDVVSRPLDISASFKAMPLSPVARADSAESSKYPMYSVNDESAAYGISQGQAMQPSVATHVRNLDYDALEIKVLQRARSVFAPAVSTYRGVSPAPGPGPVVDVFSSDRGPMRASMLDITGHHMGVPNLVFPANTEFSGAPGYGYGNYANYGNYGNYSPAATGLGSISVGGGQGPSVGVTAGAGAGGRGASFAWSSDAAGGTPRTVHVHDRKQ